MSKKASTSEIAGMFDSIAGRYDFLNHFLSMGIDRGWRKRLVRLLRQQQPAHVLDVATGTGDLAIAIAKSGVPKVTGIDISAQMLAKGVQKVESRGLASTVNLTYGNSEEIAFPDQTFDAATVAFGVRNFERLSVGLAEMYRVLKPGGHIFVLEFSMPTNLVFRFLYRFYIFKILPLLGRCVSRSKNAYSYLPQSVDEFPKGDYFLKYLREVGFVKTYRIPLTFGIAELYVGER